LIGLCGLSGRETGTWRDVESHRRPTSVAANACDGYKDEGKIML
jgi:hypothetical protein